MTNRGKQWRTDSLGSIPGAPTSPHRLGSGLLSLRSPSWKRGGNLACRACAAVMPCCGEHSSAAHRAPFAVGRSEKQRLSSYRPRFEAILCCQQREGTRCSCTCQTATWRALVESPHDHLESPSRSVSLRL